MLGILKLEPPELWLSMCKEAVESLWVRIRRRITGGVLCLLYLLWVPATDCLTGKKLLQRPSLCRWKVNFVFMITA